MKYLVSIAIATLIYAGVLVGGLSVERKVCYPAILWARLPSSPLLRLRLLIFLPLFWIWQSTSSPGTMKRYLQLRGAGESGTQ
jgi:hypothetical protein